MSRPIALRAAKEAIDNVGVQEVGDNRGKAVEIYQASTTPEMAIEKYKNFMGPVGS